MDRWVFVRSAIERRLDVCLCGAPLSADGTCAYAERHWKCVVWSAIERRSVERGAMRDCHVCSLARVHTTQLPSHIT